MNVEQICECDIGLRGACQEKAVWVVIDKTTGKITYRCTNPVHLELVADHTYSIFPLADYTKHGGHDLPPSRRDS